jgi:hypothetical protein
LKFFREKLEQPGRIFVYLASLAIRWASRETLRLALFLWTTPRCAERMITGSAALNAASAALRSPEAIASGPARDHARGFAGGLGIGHKTLVILTKNLGGEPSRRHGRGL